MVALRAIKRIGKDGRATGVQILNAESVSQYTGMAIDVYVDKTGQQRCHLRLGPAQLLNRRSYDRRKSRAQPGSIYASPQLTNKAGASRAE